jgi:transposase
MCTGQIERRTHDYDRHGTTTLFASLIAAVTATTKVKAGTLIGTCMPRHRAQEFRKFLDEVERNVPANLDLHVVMDNGHFTPTFSSWINQVERFFALVGLNVVQFRKSVFYVAACVLYGLDGKQIWLRFQSPLVAPVMSICRRTGISGRKT